jgi:hypothetical protein
MLGTTTQKTRQLTVSANRFNTGKAKTNVDWLN